MEEEQRSSIETNDTPSTSTTNTRRNRFRTTIRQRSSPYNSSASQLRRRVASTNDDESRSNSTEFHQTSNTDPIEMEMFFPEASESFLLPVLEDTENEDFQVFVNLSETSPNLSTHSSNQENETYESYHSFSTIDFDPDESEDEQQFYYTSPSSSSIPEPSLIHPNPIPTPIELTQQQTTARSPYPLHQHFIDDEDLSIEIILETSQNHSSIPSNSRRASRRRRSILPSNLIPNRGLRLSDILSIPQKLYSSLHEKCPSNSTMINTQCSICLEDFQSMDSIKILHCQHVFHAECINEWLRGHVKCAYCRTPVLLDLLQSSPSSLTTRSGEQRRRQRTRPSRNPYVVSRRPSTHLASTTIEQEQRTTEDENLS